MLVSHALVVIATVTVPLVLPSPLLAHWSKATPDSLVLDLEGARRLGLEKSPRVMAAHALLAAAQGARRQAGVYRFNPELEGKTPSLIEPGGTGSFEAFLTQELEWAGQWGLRKTAAGHGVTAAEAQALDIVRKTIYEIDLAFFGAMATQHRLAVRAEGRRLSDRLLDAVRIQARAGGVSSLEVNLAEIEAGRAQAGERSARREARSALVELKRALGLPPEERVVVAQEPDQGSGIPGADLQSLISIALESRPDLRASTAQVAQSEAHASLATREAIPNLRLSGVAERGEASEAVHWGVRVGVAVPLWNRNQGGRESARAERRRAEAERTAVELQVRSEVTTAYEAFDAAREELEIFEAHVLEPARANQRLLDTAYEAGRLDLPTVLLLRTQLLDAELAYWDVWQAERSALAALRAAVSEGPVWEGTETTSGR